jgi:hypothetical protein
VEGGTDLITHITVRWEVLKTKSKLRVVQGNNVYANRIKISGKHGNRKQNGSNL